RAPPKLCPGSLSFDPTAEDRRTVSTLPEGIVTLTGMRDAACAVVESEAAAALSPGVAELSLCCWLGLLHPPRSSNPAKANAPTRNFIRNSFLWFDDYRN